MTPQLESIVMKIASFKEGLVAKLSDEESDEIEILDEETFCSLLSALPSFRRLPGVPEHMGFDGIYHCDTPENAQLLKDHLKNVFGIVDEESLVSQKMEFYHIFNEYFDFACEWDGTPNFSLDELEDEGRHNYETSRDFAMNLRDLVGSQGFLAWDIGERIMLVRASAACGIIDDETAVRLIIEEAKIANNVFDNFIDYAISALTGAVYFMFVQMGRVEEDGLAGFLDINMRIVTQLFADDIWSLNAWCEKNYKQLAIKDDQIQALLGLEYQGKTGVASDRILCDGFRISVMVHDNPISPDDSGWRFFAGDEDPDYLQDGNNFGAVDMNLIVNYSPDVIEFLDSPVGTILTRDPSDDKMHALHPKGDDEPDPVAVG
ncbi:MAG: DUF2185 domain-containing protein [Proteobacteria bacterium]|nr:DUF2185 domain-containing protein [Pseudomonadota bacterium]